MTLSTMQDFPLTITAILRHGRRVYADSECVTWTDDGRPARDLRRGRRQRRPARGRADEARRARPATGSARSAGTRRSTSRRTSRSRAIGAVLHTLNIRLFPEQLAYVINHAEDRVIIVDDSLIPVLAKVVDDLADRRAVHRRR